MEATILKSSRESQGCNEYVGNTVSKSLTTLVMDGNWTYCGNYFEMDRNMESLHCVTQINTML